MTMSFLMKTFVSLKSDASQREDREKSESDKHRIRSDSLLIRAVTPDERGGGFVGWRFACDATRRHNGSVPRIFLEHMSRKHSKTRQYRARE